MRWKSIGTAGAAVAAAAGLGVGGAALASAKEESVTSVTNYGTSVPPGQVAEEDYGPTGAPGQQGERTTPSDCAPPGGVANPASQDGAQAPVDAPSRQDAPQAPSADTN